MWEERFSFLIKYSMELSVSYYTPENYFLSKNDNKKPVSILMIYKSDEKSSNCAKKKKEIKDLNMRLKVQLIINLLQCVNERGINAIHHNV